MLTFNADTHIYLWDEQPVPSVTQVLGEWIEAPYYYINVFTGAIAPIEAFEQGRDHGTAIHKGCALILKGRDLDWDFLDKGLIPQLEQFKKWVEDWKPTLHLIEEPLYSTKHGYAGTSDIIATIRDKVSVIDIKSGAVGLVGPQVAAYEQLYRENRKYRATIKRYILHLPKGRPYQFLPLTDKADWDFFRSRLFQYQYLINRR